MEFEFNPYETVLTQWIPFDVGAHLKTGSMGMGELEFQTSVSMFNNNAWFFLQSFVFLRVLVFGQAAFCFYLLLYTLNYYSLAAILCRWNFEIIF